MTHIDREDRLTRAVEKYGDMVYRIAYSHTLNGAAADDVYQDTFLKLVENIDKLQSEDHLKYWLIRVAINFCKKSYRHSADAEYLDELEKEDENVTDPLRADPVEDLILRKEKIRLVRSALEELTPEEYRVILYLFYYEQLRIDDIAKIMELTSGATKTKLSRARASLGKLLKQRM